MAPAVNPQDLWSVTVVCSCSHASRWDDNLSRNQVFFLCVCLGLITKLSKALDHMTFLFSRWEPHVQPQKLSKVNA